MTHINYDATPTGSQFHQSDAFGRLIAGPVGSGKTVACIFELLMRAAAQTPGADGYRYTRFAIVRQTLSQLKQTVQKDIEAWMKEAAHVKISENTIYVEVGSIKSEWIMIPLEKPEDQQRLLSSQLTGAWLSECIEMDVNLVSSLTGRCGRYPYGDRGAATWSGLIADTNMPTEGSAWWEFMESPPPDWRIFRQPSGISEQAENLNFLNQSDETRKLPFNHPERVARGREYYNRAIRNNMHNPDWIKRYVHAEYGNDPSGTAVFRNTFKRSYHVADELEPVPTRMLIVGQDFGRDPCSIICQLDHKGRLLVLEEVMADDIGLDLHLSSALRPALMQERYAGRPVMIVGDPAGRGRSSLYEENEFDLLRSAGFMAEPAPSNDPDTRLRAVEKFLIEQRQGDPALIIDGSRCTELVRAMDGGYRFSITRAGQKRPKPDKGPYSHIADALQYACLAAGGEMYSHLVGRVINRGRKRRVERVKFSARAWT